MIFKHPYQSPHVAWSEIAFQELLCESDPEIVDNEPYNYHEFVW